MHACVFRCVCGFTANKGYRSPCSSTSMLSVAHQFLAHRHIAHSSQPRRLHLKGVKCTAPRIKPARFHMKVRSATHFVSDGHQCPKPFVVGRTSPGRRCSHAPLYVYKGTCPTTGGRNQIIPFSDGLHAVGVLAACFRAPDCTVSAPLPPVQHTIPTGFCT